MRETIEGKHTQRQNRSIKRKQPQQPTTNQFNLITALAKEEEKEEEKRRK